jgi:hypothetical protein
MSYPLWSGFINEKIITKPFYCRCNLPICACISRTFLTRIYPPKLRCGLCTEYYVLLTTEPATPVLYVVKLPIETASVWDCYLASHCTRANTPKYYWCIGIFCLHESNRNHRLSIDSQKSEDRDITDKLPQMLLATTKVQRMQSQIFYFHTGKI